jgi:hypothetical protein
MASNKAKGRTASAKRVTKVWNETKSISAVAKRIGYSYVGAGRFLNRLGLVKSRA